MVTYEDVNAGLAQVVEYLKSIENVWNEIRTLKLHDVSFHASDIIDKYPLVKEEYKEDDLFSWFCEDEYDNFTEWMRENKIEDCRKYIGRTSSFYLTNINDRRIDYVLSNLIDYANGGYYSIDFDEDCKMVHFTDTEYYTEAEQIDEYQMDMEYFADGSFLKDAKKYLQDAVQIADYIDTFKEHQIENFTKYIECMNENLEDAEEQAKQEEETFIANHKTAIDRLTDAIEEVIRETGCTLSEARRILSLSFEGITLDGITAESMTA